jgi:peptidoglycan/LPS O-acetylase OafA/YrhL
MSMGGETGRGAHRPDIDGLRALAVVPVILFHAGIPGFSGGFVGVDIFFVISGYLITSIIYRDLGAGRFQLRDFYERRIRRIFPALFVMLAVCSLAGAILLLPDHLKTFGQSLVAASLSLSNIYFWLKTGYFEADASTKPLLHTWSLGVEEQFYVVFPLALILLRRLSRGQTTAVIGAACALSFGFCVWMTFRDPSAAFYLAPFRAWELLLGSLLALGTPFLPRSDRLFAVGGLAGLILIVGSVVGFGPATPFPGVAALAPSLGAALLIFAGIEALPPVNRLLAARPLVWIGLISYSLYLWHWPIFVFAAYYAVTPPTPSQQGLMIAAAFAAAAISYRFVEVPFRRSLGPLGRRRAFALGGAATACGLVCGLVCYQSNGLPGRLSPLAVALASAPNRDLSLDGCLIVEAKPLAEQTFCETHPGAAPQFILWGDSHAFAFAPVFMSAARQAGVPGILAFYEGCPPLLGVRRLDSPGAECQQFNARVLAYVRSHPSLRNVVLASRWAFYADGARYGSEGGSPPLLADSRGAARNARQNAAIFERDMAVTLKALSGHTVSIVGDPPEIGYDVPSVLARAAIYRRAIDIAPSTAEYRVRQTRTQAIFARLSAGGAATVYDVEAAYCDRLRCRISQGGVSLYRDQTHVSPLGAQQIAGIARRIIGPAETVIR